MKKTVIFGAGNIGRGLVGRIFNEAGYESVFSDVNMTVVGLLNKDGQYPLFVTMGEEYDKRIVDHVRAIDGKNTDEICRETDDIEIAATAVGVNILPIIAKTIAAIVRHRYQNHDERQINFLLCENKIDSHLLMQDLLKDLLSPDEFRYCTEHFGFCQCSIGCMVPAPPKHIVEQNPLSVCVENYNKIYTDKSGAVGVLPSIPNIIAYEPFSLYINRKLFMHNMSHALTAYLGYQKGYVTLWESIQDPEISAVAHEALNESALALSRHYGVDLKEFEEHRDDLLQRYANRLLGDTVARVGGDPVRKLSSDDRLVGAAKFCLNNDVTPTNIIKGIVAGYDFAPEGDSTAPVIREYIANNGWEKAVRHFSGLKEDDALYRMIIAERN